MKSVVSVRLPEDIDVRLTELARRTGRTKTHYVREAILRLMEDLESADISAQPLANSDVLREIDEAVRKLFHHQD